MIERVVVPALAGLLFATARLRAEDRGSDSARVAAKAAWAAALARSPIALATDTANIQHHEVPAAFFTRVLGLRLKYSSALWPEGASTLADAEEAMLSLTAERADLADGQRILDLGCGWGSLTLWMAEHYPHATIVAVSNSRTQRSFIEARAREVGSPT